MKDLFIHQFILGTWDNFIYFIGDKNTKEVMVVDPGWHADKIIEEAKKFDVNIKGALCTHSHPDHVNAVEDLLKTHDVPVYMLDHEVDFATWRCQNLKRISAGDELKIGNINIDIMHTPGHTPGSTCYHVHGNVVTGDTLFVNGCGRCDFVGGNPEVMYNTLHKLLNDLSSDTIIFPGHNYGSTPNATVKNQKAENPYMQFDTVEGFVNHRMAGRTPNTKLSL